MAQTTVSVQDCQQQAHNELLHLLLNGKQDHRSSSAFLVKQLTFHLLAMNWENLNYRVHQHPQIACLIAPVHVHMKC